MRLSFISLRTLSTSTNLYVDIERYVDDNLRNPGFVNRQN